MTEDATKQDLSKRIQQLEEKNRQLQQQLEAAEYKSHYLDNLISVLPGNVYWFDRNHVFMGCNEEHARAAGLSTRFDVVGKTNREMVWGYNADFLNANNQQVLDSGEAVVIEEINLLDGETVAYLTHKAPLRDKDQRIIGVVGVSFDISERKEHERQLKEAKEAAEQASRAKSEFIMNMSHDIRTPFSGILGLSEYLISIEKDNKKKELLEDIQTSGQQLLVLINEIIGITTSQEHQEDEIVFNIKFLIHNVASLMNAKIKEKKLLLQVDVDEAVPSMMKGKRYPIHRILLNLVSNAVKYSHQGSVTIKLSSMEEQDDAMKLRLDVSDTGIGIPADKLDIIFDKFQRLSPSYQGLYAGNGLGLWLVQQAVDSLGGEIRVQSEVNKGSTFSCIFTCKPVLSLSSESGMPRSYPIRQEAAVSSGITSILLVEDNIIAAKAANMLLSDYFHCPISHAKTATEAIHLLSESSYDLILLDLGLPDMEGLDAADQFFGLQPSAFIIGLTAHAHPKVLAQFKHHHIHSLLEKPLTLSLCETIEAAVLAV